MVAGVVAAALIAWHLQSPESFEHDCAAPARRLRWRLWALSRILTKGRALGIVVVAFLQDPRKEILPMRGLFTQTVALRLRSRDEVAMVLSDGMADAAPAHRINPNQQGTGFVIAEDGQVTRVRADFWSDSEIRSTATQYGRLFQAGDSTHE